MAAQFTLTIFWLQRWALVMELLWLPALFRPRFHLESELLHWLRLPSRSGHILPAFFPIHQPVKWYGRYNYIAPAPWVSHNEAFPALQFICRDLTNLAKLKPLYLTTAVHSECTVGTVFKFYTQCFRWSDFCFYRNAYEWILIMGLLVDFVLLDNVFVGYMRYKQMTFPF